MSNYDLATNPNTSPETLASLAKDEDYSIRWLVARNLNTHNTLKLISDLRTIEKLSLLIMNGSYM